MISLNKIILGWLKYTSQFLSFIIFLYIFFVHILNIISPLDKYIDQNVFELMYLRSLFFLGLALGFISWVIYFFQKKISFISPLFYSRSEKIYFIITSSFFSIFYISIFSNFRFFQYLIFCLLLIFFYIFIPQLINSYLNINFGELKSLLFESFIIIKKIRLGKRSSDQIHKININFHSVILDLVTSTFRLLAFLSFLLFSLLIIFVALFYVIVIINSYVKGNIYQENLKRQQFLITRKYQKKALGAYKVNLEGYNFGSKIEGDSRYNVMTSDGPVRLIEGWTNEKLEFTVPLEFTSGRKEVWLEKPVDDKVDYKIVKSNVISLEIFSRFKLFPEATDPLYIKAIKKIKRFIYFNIPIFSDFMLAQ